MAHERTSPIRQAGKSKRIRFASRYVTGGEAHPAQTVLDHPSDERLSLDDKRGIAGLPALVRWLRRLSERPQLF